MVWLKANCGFQFYAKAQKRFLRTATSFSIDRGNGGLREEITFLKNESHSESKVRFFPPALHMESKPVGGFPVPTRSRSPKPTMEKQYHGEWDGGTVRWTPGFWTWEKTQGRKEKRLKSFSPKQCERQALRFIYQKLSLPPVPLGGHEKATACRSKRKAVVGVRRGRGPSATALLTDLCLTPAECPSSHTAHSPPGTFPGRLLAVDWIRSKPPPDF